MRIIFIIAYSLKISDLYWKRRKTLKRSLKIFYEVWQKYLKKFLNTSRYPCVEFCLLCKVETKTCYFSISPETNPRTKMTWRTSAINTNPPSLSDQQITVYVLLEYPRTSLSFCPFSGAWHTYFFMIGIPLTRVFISRALSPLSALSDIGSQCRINFFRARRDFKQEWFKPWVVQYFFALLSL
jgi:hypothetical protein